jgi:hypothetical protein
MLLLFTAKFIGISSPFILRSVINGLTETYATALAAGSTVVATSGSFTLVKMCGAIGLWGLTR